jgi:ribose transport system permease protein
VVTLAIGLAGIGQMGANFWVNPLFNGITLLIAVGLAGWSARRKIMAGIAANRAADDPGPHTSSLPQVDTVPDSH